MRVDLPSAALDMLESDTHDSVYYMVNDAKGAFVAGHRGLPLPTGEAPAGKPLYYDGNYRGSPIRIAALHAVANGAPADEQVLVLVGETLNKRRTLANEVLLGMLLPALLLIALVGALVWYGIERGLRPLATLQQEIGNRSHRDLSALPEQNAPGEVRALIRAMNELLDLVKRDRKWKEEAARKQLVVLFEALGFTDPRAIEGRRKLSGILFS